MRIKYSAVALVFIIALSLYSCTKYETPPGKTGILTGRVIDSATSGPVDSVSIILSGAAGAYDTVSSNYEGKFTLSCAMSWTNLQVNVLFQKAGYQNKNIIVELIADKTVDIGDVRIRP